MALSHLIATWHPALVHFPIALLFVAFFLELTAYWRYDPKASWAALVLQICGTLGILVTFVTGQYAQIVDARGLTPQDPINLHEAYAIATSWGFVGMLVWRSYLKPENRLMHRAYLVGFGIGLSLLLLTGYLGGQLVYKYAAGVIGVHSPYPPTPKDLSNLTLVQSQPELVYSDMMHHVFGWMTVFLGLWLGYQHFDFPGQNRIRALGPMALFAGGLFLFVFSDWDAWPLASIKPITDPEVMFHKITATLMIFFGIGMNLARKRPAGEDVANMQSHLIALLALIGGGMLFTHVHTGAPYSDAAIGVYIQHFVVGVTALSCGGVKMLELIRPRQKRLWNLIWIVLLLFAGFNLVTYHEGFPFYVNGDQVPFWTGNQG